MEGFLIFVVDAFSLSFLKSEKVIFFFFFFQFFLFLRESAANEMRIDAVADRHYKLNGLTGPGLEMILGPFKFWKSNNTHTVENT